MEYEWNYSDENVDWNELSHLYLIAPLGQKTPSGLQVSFSNSMFKCFVYDSRKLIAAGRALADGVDCSYIADIAVHPDYQGKGLGTQLVEKLVDFSRGHRKIILYTTPGKETFYLNLGFKRMSTAMAIFKDQDQALKDGLVIHEPEYRS
jgi:ribosomal protein S18 acetylase RimI-like enzyme